MTNGKRDYKREAEWEKSHRGGKRLKDRRARHRARYAAEKAGLVKRNDGKEVDHIKSLDSGGSYSVKNTRVVSHKTNAQKEVKRKRSRAGNN